MPSWHTVDPLAKKYYWISPYVYCTNNPVNAVDPDGKEKKNVFPNQNGQAEIAQKAIVDNFQDSPNTIVIFGHGDSNGIHIYGNNGDMIVNSVGSFIEYLDKESVAWQTRYVTGAKISIDADQQPGSVSFDMKYGKWGKSELINKDKMVPWK